MLLKAGAKVDARAVKCVLESACCLRSPRDSARRFTASPSRPIAARTRVYARLPVSRLALPSPSLPAPRRERSRTTPLMFAASEQRMNVVRVLVENGAVRRRKRASERAGDQARTTAQHGLRARRALSLAHRASLFARTTSRTGHGRR